MAKAIMMPQLGVTMERARITTWMKQEGDSVRQGDVLCVIESDKINFGIEAPERGGLTFNEVVSLISKLSPLHVVGFDVVELSPPYDPTQQSAMAAAKLIRELILQFCPDKNRP